MTKKKVLFTKEEIKSISHLGDVLRQIQGRLFSEGKIRIDKNGKTVFLKIKKKPI